MAEFTLRLAAESDSTVIRKLVHDSRINPMNLDWRKFIIAESPEGKVAGIGQVKLHGADLRELASIVVAPEYRGLGVARLIINHLLETHPKPVYLMCRSQLETFYKKFGFRALAVDEMPDYFRRLVVLARTFSFIQRNGNSLLVMIKE